jgi:hypothetical protein
MWRTTWGLALLLAAGPAWAAPDDKPDKKDLSPAEEVDKLTSDYDKAQKTVYEKLREAKTDEERTRIVEEGQPKPGPVVARLMELAEKHPTDRDVNPKALIWVVSVGYDPERRPAVDKALGLLARDFAADKEVAQLCLSVANLPTDAAEKFLRAVAEKGGSEDAKGKATIALAQYLKRMAELAGMIKSDAESTRMLEQYLGKEATAKLAEADADKMFQEAEKQFDSAAEKYPTVVMYGEHTIGESAKGELFELRHLSVGKAAPEIEGDDLDGKAFKLSDYRGKVVVIDFWGNW